MSVPGPESVEPQGPSQEAVAADAAAAEWAAAMAPEGSAAPPVDANEQGAGTNEAPSEIITEGAQQPDAVQPLEAPASSEASTDGSPAPVDIDRIPWRPAAKEHVLRILGGAPLSGATAESGDAASDEVPSTPDGETKEPAEGTAPSPDQTPEPLSPEPEPGESAPENAPEPAGPDTVPVLEELTEAQQLEQEVKDLELQALRNRRAQLEAMVAAQERASAAQNGVPSPEQEAMLAARAKSEAFKRRVAAKHQEDVERQFQAQVENNYARREFDRTQGLPDAEKAEFAKARHDAIKARFDDAVDRLVHSDTPKNVQLEMLVPYDIRMSWNRPGEKIHTFTISEYTKGYNDPSTSQTKYVVVPESQMGGWLLNSTSLNSVDAHRKGEDDHLYTNKTSYIIDEHGRNWGGGFLAYRVEDGPAKLGLVPDTKGAVEQNLALARDLETDQFLSDRSLSGRQRTLSPYANRVLSAIDQMQAMMRAETQRS